MLNGSNAAKDDHTLRTGDPSIAFNKPEHKALLDQYRASIDLVQDNHIGRQLLADDVGQIQPDASEVDSAEKWVGIALMDTPWDGPRPTNIKALVENKLIGGVMSGYLGVSLARGPEHAKDFINACNTMLQNVGYHLACDESVSEVRLEIADNPKRDRSAMAISPKLDDPAANKDQDSAISAKIADILRNGFK